MKTTDRLATLFDWPARQSVQIVLPLMFVVAAAAHVAGLAAFRLSQPAPEPLHRSSATVYALLPVTGGSRAMESLLAADDPVLFSPSSSEQRGIWNLPATDYRPALSAMVPSLKTWQPPTESPARLPALVAAPLPQTQTPSEEPASAPASTAPMTVVRFSDDLAARTPEYSSSARFAAPEKQDLLPATFLVAAGADGRILHVFPLETSGYDALDTEAARSLHEIQLAPAEGTTWGTATFLWGNDVRPLRVE